MVPQSNFGLWTVFHSSLEPSLKRILKTNSEERLYTPEAAHSFGAASMAMFLVTRVAVLDIH